MYLSTNGTLIGEALEYSCVPEIVCNCVNEVAKEFSEIEEEEVLKSDWQDEVEDLPQIQSDKVLHYFRPSWNGGRENYKIVEGD